MTTPTPEAFLTFFPNFKDVPTDTLNAYLALVVKQVPDGRFRAETEYGRYLLVAHQLTVNGLSGKEASAVGGVSGAIASKTVGSVSVSYDTGGSSETDAGFYNATIYGKQYYALMRKYRTMPFVAYGKSFKP